VNREKISRVHRTKEQAKRAYDRMSRIYDCIAGPFEKKYRNMALEKLNIKDGEIALEVGFGTGRCLVEIAKRVGNKGKTFGIDISSGMLKMTRKRLKKEGLAGKVKLYCGDALSMPYEDDKFDAVFLSFTLELFDTPEIPAVLKEMKRVLKPGGRLGVVSMSKEVGESVSLKVYEWFHKNFPALADCRPIYVEQSIKDAGYQIKYKETIKLSGLPGEIVVGVAES